MDPAWALLEAVADQADDAETVHEHTVTLLGSSTAAVLNLVNPLIAITQPRSFGRAGLVAVADQCALDDDGDELVGAAGVR